MQLDNCSSTCIKGNPLGAFCVFFYWIICGIACLSVKGQMGCLKLILIVKNFG
jgi:hypothetical protein